MNKKGQVNKEVGLIILVAITIIVGAILLQAVISEQTKSTTLGSWNTTKGNGALTVVANATTQLQGKYVYNFLAWNASTGNLVGSGNYTITNNYIDSTGTLASKIVLGDPTEGVNSNWNISYDYQPLGYISDSGGRAIAGLIALFFALAIALVALIPTLPSLNI